MPKIKVKDKHGNEINFLLARNVFFDVDKVEVRKKQRRVNKK